MMAGSRDNGSTNGGGWNQYPAERGLRRQLSRHQCRERAARLMSCYLRQVASALRAEGLAVSDTWISPGPDLEARLRLRPDEGPAEPTSDPTGRAPIGGQPYEGPIYGAVERPVDGPVDGAGDYCPLGLFELSWAEDTGWRVEHHLLGGPTGAAPWRYLHLELVPAPSAVARFAAAVLTGLDDVGMPYPAQFRFRSQPLQPVIDALAHHAAAPDTAGDINTDAATDVAVGEGLAEPVTEPQRKVGTHAWH